MSLNSGSNRESSHSDEGQKGSKSRIRTQPPLNDTERERIAATSRRDLTPQGYWPPVMNSAIANGRVSIETIECTINRSPDTHLALYAEGGHVRISCDHSLCWITPEIIRYNILDKINLLLSCVPGVDPPILPIN